MQLEGLRKRHEGLVHVSHLRREGRVSDVSEVIQKGLLPINLLPVVPNDIKNFVSITPSLSFYFQVKK